MSTLQCPPPTSPNEDPDQEGIALAVAAGVPTSLFLGAVAMIGARFAGDAETRKNLNQLGNGQLMQYLSEIAGRPLPGGG